MPHSSCFKTFPVILVFLLSMQSRVGFSQSPRDSQLEEKAITAFDAGKYADALPEFGKLLSRYPRDPMYNYYHGVCMVSLNQEPAKALNELRMAALGTVPEDVFFYLGKAAFQMDQYPDAIRYFEKFSEISDTRTRQKYHVSRWIEVTKMYYRNPGHKINPKNLAVTYQAALDTAMHYQHKLDSVNYLIRKTEQITGNNPEKQDQLNLLKEERDYYANIASDYFSLVRKMETSGNVKVTDEHERAGGNVSKNSGSPYLEPTGENFYLQPGIRLLIDDSDRQRLEELSRRAAHAGKLMEEALEINSEIQKQKVIANGAGSKRESKMAIRKAERLEQEKMNKRMEAIGYFQSVNDEKYAIYNKYMERMFLKANAKEPAFRQANVYKNEAEKSRKEVFSLRAEAEKQKNTEKRYDKLMESNAYELIALDNQKKALGTLTGLVPVADENLDVRWPVAEVPKTTIPQITPSENNPVNTEKNPKTKDNVVAANTPKKQNEKIPDVLKDAKAKLSGTVVEHEKTNTGPVDPRINELSGFPYGFTLMEKLPYDPEHPIPEMEKLPQGVNYKIQVAAFSRQPDLSYFKGMYPLSREEVPGKNLSRYYTGLFRKYDDALKALVKVRKLGFPDAIIVGFYNGERSSLERIRWLEDELPYENVSADKANITLENPQKTTPGPALAYRVQLGAFKNKIPQKKLNYFTSLAENYDLKISKNPNGIMIYSIGNFLTFEKAEEFKNKLLSKGVKGVFVTAWKNGKRIPLEKVQK